MLRTLLVVGVLLLGIWRSRKGPFHLLLLYLWLAYFRPEEWVWSDFITPLRLSYWIGLSLLISVVLSSKERFTWGLGPTLLLVFLIHSLLSTVQSDVAAYSWLYWQEFAKILTIGYLMIVMVRDQERFRW